MEKKIKRIWFISLILITVISLGVSVYIYTIPTKDEEIAIKVVKEAKKLQTFPNKVSANKIFIKDNLIAISYNYVTDEGYNSTQKELWKYEDNKVKYLGNDDGIKVQDLPIGYLSMSNGNEKIITDIMNSEESKEINTNKINRLSR